MIVDAFVISLLWLLFAGHSTVFEARRQWFSPGTQVSSPPSSVNGLANKTKAQINVI